MHLFFFRFSKNEKNVQTRMHKRSTRRFLSENTIKWREMHVNNLYG
jgi:hypothetical protein